MAKRKTIISDFHSLRGAAARANVSVQTIERLVDSGDLVMVRMRSKKQITRQSLDDYLNGVVAEGMERANWRKQARQVSTKGPTPSFTGHHSSTKAAKELDALLNALRKKKPK